MELQKACETLERLSEKETSIETAKLTMSEFLALQWVLLELQAQGKYTPKDDVEVM